MDKALGQSGGEAAKKLFSFLFRLSTTSFLLGVVGFMTYLGGVEVAKKVLNKSEKVWTCVTIGR